MSAGIDRWKSHIRGSVGFGCLIAVAMQIASTVSLAKPPDKSYAWPQFLGPDRNGISAETGLIDSWPANGPKEVWRIPGGVGMSGISVKGDRVVTLIQKDGQQWLIARKALTGKPIWDCALAPEYKNGMGNGPRGTPAISGQHVLAFTGEGILTAVNFSDGKPVWSHNCVEELGGEVADYGMACSPLVNGDHVIVTIGAPEATVAAYDIRTGKLAWKSGNDPAGYSSPVLLDVGGESQLVVYSGSSVLGMKPETGSILWRHPYETNFHCNIVTPISVKGQVFVSSGENHGSVLLAVKKNGDRFDVKETWASQGTKSVLRNEWQTSILLDGYLYGFDNVGAAGPVSHLTCINATTGERVWQKLRFGKGNMVLAENKLFISTMNGELVVVRATPKGFEEIGRAEILGATRQTPTIADGHLYLRDDREIVCLDIQKP